MNYTTFLTYFPEFEERDQSDIEYTIMRVDLAANSYAGLVNPKRRELAVGLHAAHLLTVDSRQSKGESGVVTEMKTHNDQVKFAVSSDMAGFGYSSTTYGKELEALLANELTSGLLF
jgi:hypothetical protein